MPTPGSLPVGKDQPMDIALSLKKNCAGLFKSLSILTGLTLFAIFSLANAVIAADEKTTTGDDQVAMAVSLYQHELALIKDTRRITLDDGVNNLVWQEISAKIRPESAWIRDLTHPEQLQIIAQHFDLDPLSPQKLLESHTGKTLSVIRTNPVTGAEDLEKATVLTTNGGVILQFADRVETNTPGRLIFSEIPDNLRVKPAMMALVHNLATKKLAQRNLQLIYLTHGLSWQADYILEIDRRENLANLTGMATLTNRSGADYHDAKLELIAGDINLARPASAPNAKRLSREMEMASAAYADMAAEPHFELHRYTLQEKTTLPDNQSKQVVFISANNIPVEKKFFLQGQSHYYSGYHHHPEQKQAVDVYINFQNMGDDLDVPLPRGVIRTYQQDQQGELHFVGEDNINHTPGKAAVQLLLGQAFDITAEKKQFDFKKIPSPEKHIRQFESAHQITLHNAKKEAVNVVVREPIPGDWHILAESQPHQKITAYMAEWNIEVPAESHAVLTYRIRTTL